jgi:hypothetical protein
VEARVRAATGQLRLLGAFEDTSSIPMRHLTDEQLDQRIRQVQGELNKLKKGPAAARVCAGDTTRAEAAAVTHQLEVLDYLIEHPDASIAPTSVLDAMEDEPDRWAAALLPDDGAGRKVQGGN